MNRKGFTLIELLAVIVILAVIAIIVTPIIASTINSVKDQANQRTMDGYARAAEEYIFSEKVKGNDVSGTNVLSKLQVGGSKATGGTIFASSDGKASLALVISGICYTKNGDNPVAKADMSECNSTTYRDYVLNSADPVLTSGMIPVNIANDGTVTKADTTTNWYSYENKKWANIVLVSDPTVVRNNGDVINNILAYFVWIPRYRYQLFNATGASGTKSQTINIAFESSSTSKSNGTTNGTWLTHPAFTFGSEEVNGFWFGKFATTGSATAPTILPKLLMITGHNLATEFTTAQKFSTYGLTNVDSHMVKNSEWGAVAYLSYSVYGKNGEVSVNNNSNALTGYAAVNKATAGWSSTSISINQFGTDTSVTQPYNTTVGYGASTTGNITGVYDMSGGIWTNVMGNLSGNLESSGFTTLPDSKYYESYTSGQNILGDAMMETAGWNADYNEYVTTSYPWFVRGGYYKDGIATGIFSYGCGSYGYPFRVALFQ